MRFLIAGKVLKDDLTTHLNGQEILSKIQLGLILLRVFQCTFVWKFCRFKSYASKQDLIDGDQKRALQCFAQHVSRPKEETNF